jgi:glycosyltransferase involved in cell wall biosynthesis
VKVSVVLIFLNGEAFLDEAIRSVVGQTFDDWELLLVDDGSTDTSTTIATAWAARDRRIKYLEHPGHENLGMSASRNLGLEHALGEYVSFLDCDDVLLPHKVASQVAILDADETLDATYGAHRLWYSWTGSAADQARDTVEPIGVAPDTVAEPGELLRLYRTRSGCVPAIHAILARRTSVLAVGGFADEFRTCHEDQVFYAKLGLHFRTFIAGSCDVLYRQHHASCVSLAHSEGTWHPSLPSPTQRRFLEWLERYLLDNGVKDEVVWASLREALDVYRQPLGRAALRAHSARAVEVAKTRLRQPVARMLTALDRSAG